MAKPRPQVEGPVTMEAALDKYMSKIETLKSHKSWLAYGLTLRAFVKMCGSKLQIQQVTKSTLENFAVSMVQSGLGDRN